MNYDEMEASRSLDASVAEQVMGWTVEAEDGRWRVHNPQTGNSWMESSPRLTDLAIATSEDDPYGRFTLPLYSACLADAWLVVEKWDGDFDLRRQNDQYRCELFQPSREWQAWGETPALAICRAALRATEEER